MKSRWKILHPATMFFLFTVAIVFLSWIFDVYGLNVVYPPTGELIYVQSLISPEGVRWSLKNIITNFTGFEPLGPVIITMFGIGVAEHSGFINACIRCRPKKKQYKEITILAVIFIGLLSNIIGDAGYIILLPIAATLFHSAGMHPIAGIITAFASVACGFSANIIIGTLDPLLAATTQDAIISANIGTGNIGRLSNYYFMFASTFLIAVIIYFITTKKLIPDLGKYEGAKHKGCKKPLSKRERRALILAIIIGTAYLLIVLWATFSSWGLLRGITGDLVSSPFIVGILFIVSLYLGIMGVAYGFASGKYRNNTDVIKGLNQLTNLFGIYLVMTFFASQMFACLEYSHLDKCFAIAGANLLLTARLNAFWMIILFILFTAVINLLITSATAKWTFMSFLFVPVFVKLGISPDYTQCAFRIGDSATNAITPFLVYVPLVIAYIHQYDEGLTYGGLLKHTWRYSIYILMAWIILFIIWYYLRIPLGL